MKHIFVIMHIIALLFSFTSIFFTFMIYSKKRSSAVKNYAFLLIGLTLTLAEQTAASYLRVNAIGQTYLEVILTMISSTGCSLIIFYLPSFMYSFFEKEMPALVRSIFWVLACIPLVTIVLYYTLPWPFIILTVSNLALLISVIYTVTIGIKYLKTLSDKRRRILKVFLTVMCLFIPYLFLDIKIESLPGIGRHFPYGILSLPLFYIILNSISLYIGVKEWTKSSIIEEKLQDAPTANTDEMLHQFNITPREREVISLLIKGYSYTQMADELVISLSTTKSHVYNIYQKTGVKNKVELINLLNGKQP